MKRFQPHLIGLILVLAFIARLHQLQTPLADWHSWRQADTASVTREYVKHGVDLLRPRYHDLSAIPNGKDNPQGYRMVEFPVINGVTAWFYTLTLAFHHWQIHVFARFLSILFSLGSIYMVYKIVTFFSEDHDWYLGLLAAAVFAFLPYNLFYSRVVLPEVPLVFFALVKIYVTLRYIATEKTSYYLSAIITAMLALLLKPTAIFFFLPLLVLATYQKGIAWVLKPKHLAAVAFAAAPFVGWRLWISQFPEGIPANRWLFNGNGIRLRPAWFRWLFAERLGKLILGYWGLILFALGLQSLPTPQLKATSKLLKYLKSLKLKKNDTYTASIFYFSWLASMLLYLIIFATGNVQHDYYQIVLVPIICIFVALGIDYLLKLNKLTSYFILLASVFMMLFMGWYEVKGYYNINNPAIVEAGKAIDQLTPPDALVIAPYQGDTAFLYQTNRRGWPIGGNIEDKIDQGATYYVTTAFDDEAKTLAAQYSLLTQTPSYTIIKLQ